jgi:hypothetical protein
MLKRVVVIAVFVFLSSQAALAQGACQRDFEPLGGFSFCPPDGWGLTKKEGQKFKLAYGLINRDFTPTIFIDDETNPAPLAAYAARVVKVTLESYRQVGAESVKVLEQGNFMTANRTPGIRVVFRTERKDLVIRMLQYYFNGKEGQKLIFTCAALEKDRETFDPIFERAMKTFQLER